MHNEITTLRMKRNHDCKNVSGEGFVCSMAIMPSGKLVSEWTSQENPNSIGIYNSFGDFLALHVFSHPENQTEIWSDQWSPIQGSGDLPWLMAKQEQFENRLVGTDGKLKDINTPKYALERGVIGEGQECLEALAEGDTEAAKLEAIDVLIFLSTLFNHLNMTPDEVQQLSRQKMTINFEKYRPEHFTGETVVAGLAKSRQLWSHHKK